MTGREDLAAKLDEDIDNFMDDLVKKRKQKPNVEKKPWNFEEWEREIDKHPAFMKEMPDDGDLPESIQALQALKYGEDESPDDRATSFKAEGNKHHKNKHYKWAVKAYTEGLKCQPTDNALLAALHCNRAAAQVMLSNCGSAFKDCAFALKCDPQYNRACIRGCECLLSLKKPDKAIQWLNSYDIDIGDTRKELLAKAETQLKLVQRDERKKNKREQKENEHKQSLLDTVKSRKIQFAPNLARFVDLGGDLKETVRLDEGGVLCWDVLVRYPGPDIQDVVKDFAETSTFRQLLHILLENPSEELNANIYKEGTVKVQYKDYRNVSLMSWSDISMRDIDNLDETLGDILSRSDYTVANMQPLFYIVPKGLQL